MVAEACLLGGKSAGRQGCFVLHSALLDWLRCFCVAVYPGVLQIGMSRWGLKCIAVSISQAGLFVNRLFFGVFQSFRLMTYEIGNENV